MRFLLRNWLQGLATEKIREQFDETVHEQAGGDLCADIGVVFALAIEAGGMVDLLEGFSSIRGSGFVAQLGELAGRRLAVFESGSGRQRAAAATEALIETHGPSWVISAGFAGGLSSLINRHDIVMADSVVNAEGRRLAIDLKIDPVELPSGVHVGRILSVDQIARLPEDKESLGRRHGALAVDLESFAVAEVCHRHGVRFLGVRIITDTMDEQLPVDIQHLTDQTTAASRLGAAIGSVYRRPSSLKEMLQLKENALTGSDRLANFLNSTIRQLAPLDDSYNGEL
jgi:adenosylhomocysteine nucleosidase